MKKYLKSLLICLFASVFTGCSNENEFENIDNTTKAKVTFVYTLDTSNGGSMSRAVTNTEVFNEFYEKLKSGELYSQLRLYFDNIKRLPVKATFYFTTTSYI